MRKIIGTLVFIFAGLCSLSFAAGPRYPWPDGSPISAAPAAPAPVATQSFASGPAGVAVQPPPPQAPLQNTPEMNATDSMFKMLNNKGTSGGGNFEGDDEIPAYGYSSNYGFMEQKGMNGDLEPCTSPPPPQRTQQAFHEAIQYRGECPAAQRGDDQRIVINDYSSVANIPYMYIFTQDGKCLGKTAVTYGNGVGQTTPQPCSDGNGHVTPPGFHLTSSHDTATYPAGTCLGMVGLEGQDSQGRGILIHPAARPGTASSWGCAGVGSFKQVAHTIGKGALVYNFFGDKPTVKGCSSQNGMKPHHFCHLDPGGKGEIPAISTGQGTGAAR